MGCMICWHFRELWDKSQEFTLVKHFTEMHTACIMYKALLGTGVAMTSALKAELNVPRDLVGARPDRYRFQGGCNYILTSGQVTLHSYYHLSHSDRNSDGWGDKRRNSSLGPEGITKAPRQATSFQCIFWSSSEWNRSSMIPLCSRLL